MTSTIRRQVDSDYAGDDFVAFVEAEELFIKGRPHEDMVGGETYFVSLHYKPIGAADPMGFARCKHRHRSIDAAAMCARQMLRTARRAK